MKVNLTEEYAKPKCVCSRCSIEPELWEDYLKFPWRYHKGMMDRYHEAMWNISRAWCWYCESFETCPCGDVGAKDWCGMWNPCSKHLEAYDAYWKEGKKTLKERWLARKWKALRNNPKGLKQELIDQITKIDEAFRKEIK